MSGFSDIFEESQYYNQDEIYEGKIKKYVEQRKLKMIYSHTEYSASVTRYHFTIPESAASALIATYDRPANAKLFGIVFNNSNVTLKLEGNDFIITLPNEKRSLIRMREGIKALDAVPKSIDKLEFLCGIRPDDNFNIIDMNKTRSMLICGASGNGKSIAMHNMILSMLNRYSSEELEIYMIDGKGTELTWYEGLPQVKEIVTFEDEDKILPTVEKVRAILNEKNSKMMHTDEYKYPLLSDYNKKHPESRMPYTLLIIDEFDAIMGTSMHKELSAKLAEIGKLGRSTGVYLIIASQRPEQKVVSLALRQSLNSRVIFKLDSRAESRTYLGENGAEKLMEDGDAMVRTSTSEPVIRTQFAYIDIDERIAAIEYLKKHCK